MTAWNIYSSILIEERKQPKLPNQLAIHLEQVLELHKEGGNWLYYDEEFRRQVAIGKATWGQIHAQALNRSFVRGSSHKALERQSSFQASDLSEQDIPIGFCRAFNLSGICHRFKCNWQHKCCNCLGSNHGVINCSQPLSLPFRRAPGSSFKRPGFANTKHNKTSNGRSGPGAEFGKGK